MQYSLSRSMNLITFAIFVHFVLLLQLSNQISHGQSLETEEPTLLDCSEHENNSTSSFDEETSPGSLTSVTASGRCVNGTVLHEQNSVLEDPEIDTSNFTDNVIVSHEKLPVFAASETCIAGQYTTAALFTSLGDCIDCLAGTYSTIEMSSSCTQCPSGTFSGAMASVCTVCGHGAYAPSSSSSVCVYCLAGQYATSFPTPAPCLTCPAGRFRSINSAPVPNRLWFGPWYPMSFKWGNNVWRFANRYYGSYDHLQYPVFYSTTTYLSHGIGCGHFQVSKWFFKAGAITRDGRDCPVGGTGVSTNFFGSDPRLEAVIAASTNRDWCTSCPAGTYSSAAASTVCISCDVGKYSATVSATLSSVCISCDIGKFTTAAGASRCTTCVPGKYTTASFILSDGDCTSCLAGTYSPIEGSTSCTRCPNGTFSGDVASVCTVCAHGAYAPSSSSSVCVYCLAGQYATSFPTPTPCLTCLKGRFRSINSAPVPNRLWFGPWYPMSFRWGNNIWIFANKYYGSYDHLQYPVYYSTTPFLSYGIGCGHFQVSSWNFVHGAFTRDGRDCPVGVAGHRDGFFGSDPTLQAVINASTNIQMCAQCPAGTYSSAEASTVCTSCVVGTYSATVSASSSAACKSCDAGKFTTAAGASICTSCIPGTYTTASFISSTSDCINCLAGTYSQGEASSSCTQCLNGTFSAAAASVCTVCSDGSYAPSSSSSVCVYCLAGQYTLSFPTPDPCLSCPVGKFRSINSVPVQDKMQFGPWYPMSFKWGNNVWVFANKYFGSYDFSQRPVFYSETSYLSHGIGCAHFQVYNWFFRASAITRDGRDCLVGGSGIATNFFGTDPNLQNIIGASTNIEWCLPCSAGTYSSAEASSTCTPCVAGKYSTVVSASSPAVCQSCDAGKYSAVVSASSSAICLSCDAGKYSSVASSTTCTSCFAGKYSSGVFASSSAVCQSCDAGKYSAVVSASSSAICLSCDAGKYSSVASSTTCTSCVAGKYSSDVSASSSAVCMPCDAGKYSSTISASSSNACRQCELCSTNGFFRSGCGGANSGTCEMCVNL